jgi:hypothetical protein
MYITIVVYKIHNFGIYGRVIGFRFRLYSDVPSVARVT